MRLDALGLLLSGLAGQEDRKGEGGWKARIERVKRGRKRDEIGAKVIERGEVEWNMGEGGMERGEGGWNGAEVGVEEGEGTRGIGTGEGDAGSAGQVREG